MKKNKKNKKWSSRQRRADGWGWDTAEPHESTWLDCQSLSYFLFFLFFCVEDDSSSEDTLNLMKVSIVLITGGICLHNLRHFVLRISYYWRPQSSHSAEVVILFFLRYASLSFIKSGGILVFGDMPWCCGFSLHKNSRLSSAQTKTRWFHRKRDRESPFLLCAEGRPIHITWYRLVVSPSFSPFESSVILISSQVCDGLTQQPGSFLSHKRG